MNKLKKFGVFEWYAIGMIGFFGVIFPSVSIYAILNLK
tara:strand:- start:235 stop:348 length:114 start_codon:yes stop_codon:yes gene_type:complete